MLSCCGLTTSRCYIFLTTQAKHVVKGIQDSETEPLHLLKIDAASWDNLEQKDKSDGSVHSWTTGLHHCFHQPELKTDACKVYDSSGGNPLSQERKDWVHDIIEVKTMRAPLTSHIDLVFVTIIHSLCKH